MVDEELELVVATPLSEKAHIVTHNHVRNEIPGERTQIDKL